MTSLIPGCRENDDQSSRSFDNETTDESKRKPSKQLRSSSLIGAYCDLLV